MDKLQATRVGFFALKTTGSSIVADLLYLRKLWNHNLGRIYLRLQLYRRLRSCLQQLLECFFLTDRERGSQGQGVSERCVMNIKVFVLFSTLQYEIHVGK